MRTYISEDKAEYSYDYDKQVWILDGKYQDCGHPNETNCGCYGRKHKGEQAVITDKCN